MFRVQSGERRWVNLPYALAMALVLLIGLVSEETPGALLPYLVLLPLFIIQLLWPTLAGWAAIMVAWFVLFFLWMLYARLYVGITEFNNWALVLIGLAPMVPLYIFRPRSQDGRTSTRTDTRRRETGNGQDVSR